MCSGRTLPPVRARLSTDVQMFALELEDKLTR
jgi:hypothetical protein